MRWAGALLCMQAPCAWPLAPASQWQAAGRWRHSHVVRHVALKARLVGHGHQQHVRLRVAAAAGTRGSGASRTTWRPMHSRGARGQACGCPRMLHTCCAQAGEPCAGCLAYMQHTAQHAPVGEGNAHAARRTARACWWSNAHAARHTARAPVDEGRVQVVLEWRVVRAGKAEASERQQVAVEHLHRRAQAQATITHLPAAQAHEPASADPAAPPCFPPLPPHPTAP